MCFSPILFYFRAPNLGLVEALIKWVVAGLNLQGRAEGPRSGRHRKNGHFNLYMQVGKNGTVEWPDELRIKIFHIDKEWCCTAAVGGF